MQSIQTNGVQLAYVEHGHGAPLLFVHGLGSSARDWSAQLAHFSRNHRALAVDLRGHGHSDKPPGPYSMRMFADDLAGLIKQLAIDPAHVVGLSLGGMVALQLAVDHPHLLRSLVIVNSAPAVVPRTPAQRLEFKKREWIVRFLGMRWMGRVLAGRLLPEPQQRALHDTFIERWASNDRKAYLASLRAIVGWSVLNHIGDIEQPVLVVSADQDYTTVEQKRMWMALLPDARMQVIDRSRHMTPLDRPAAFNSALEKFLGVLGT